MQVNSSAHARLQQAVWVVDLNCRPSGVFGVSVNMTEADYGKLGD
jgi:hypothetical protein